MLGARSWKIHSLCQPNDIPHSRSLHRFLLYQSQCPTLIYNIEFKDHYSTLHLYNVVVKILRVIIDNYFEKMNADGTQTCITRYS